MTPSRHLVRELEAVAARAWPAPLVEPLDGWLLRYNDGVTRRANSVLPNGAEGQLALHEKLRRAEEFYERRGLTPRFQVSPAAEPEDLDALLAARGYRLLASTWMQSAPLSELLACTAGQANMAVVQGNWTDDWLAAYCETMHMNEPEARGRRAILEHLQVLAGYALVAEAGKTVALGLGVQEGEWLGVFSMVTQVAYRRRGLATALLHALAAWGQKCGASRAYLQVMQDNPPALALYERVGFRTLYGYHYREKPLANPG